MYIPISVGQTSVSFGQVSRFLDRVAIYLEQHRLGESVVQRNVLAIHPVILISFREERELI